MGKYTKNNIPCSSSLHEDKRHNFDFSKPIKVGLIQENVISTPEVQEGKVSFELTVKNNFQIHPIILIRLSSWYFILLQDLLVSVSFIPYISAQPIPSKIFLDLYS